MSSPSRSTSEVAREILLDAFRKKPVDESSNGFRWWLHWMRFDLVGRIPWHQVPLARRLPVPWFVPIGRFDQFVFAEALRECLVEGLTIPRAIDLAASVNPCPCFRRGLLAMYANVCAGHPLGESLKRSRAWVGRALPSALEVGEEFGSLPDALATFVEQDPTFTGARFRKAIGRRPESTRFATALARLLRDHPLTWKLVGGAGRLSGGSARFEADVQAIAESMRDGRPFAMALGRFPRHFDRMFRAFLERIDCREEMAACLERLAVAGDAP